jgi:hypothetical protein
MKGEVGGEKVRIDFKNSASSGPSSTNFTLTTEWVRYEISVTNDTGTSRGFQFRCTISNVPSDQTFYVWGAQCEQGSYATSYIPTRGQAATRAKDFCTKTGLTSLINSTQGTIFLDFEALANVLPSEYSYFSMSDGTYNNRISIVQSIGATNQVRAFAFLGGTKVFDMNGSVTDITNQTKVVLRYAENAFDLFINGAKASSDTSGSIFPSDTLNRISFSEIGTSASTFIGKVNQSLYFPTTLSDNECINLTSL